MKKKYKRPDIKGIKMNKKQISVVAELIERYPALLGMEKKLDKSLDLLTKCYENGGKLLLCGNGGSASDCLHISGELMKGFLLKRKLNETQKESFRGIEFADENFAEKLQNGLPSISLMGETAFYTAYGNDVDASMTFAQEVYILGKENDVLLCISTSGNSKNVVNAAICAKAKNIPVIALTGKNEGKLSRLADVCLNVPETETFKVQEYHLPIYHTLCALIEYQFFDN